MTDAALSRSAQPPLLRTDELVVELEPGQTLGRPGTLVVEGESLACVGSARALLPVTIDQGLLRGGSLLLRGEVAQALLASGRAGYCPQTLPAPQDFRVEDALIGSARLIGLGSRDVRRALERTEAEGLAKKRLKDLGPLQHRLVGLAHGLVSDPELVLIEDPCLDLDDEPAELVLTVLERELKGRSWILGTDLRSPWSRRLFLTAELAVAAEAGALLGPVPPAELNSPGKWARFDRVSEELLRGLEGRGAQVVRTPSENVVLLRRLSGLAALEVAASVGACLLELTPLSPGD